MGSNSNVVAKSPFFAQGSSGAAGGDITVNGVAAIDGNITLTSQDVDARPNTPIKTYSITATQEGQTQFTLPAGEIPTAWYPPLAGGLMQLAFQATPGTRTLVLDEGVPLGVIVELQYT